VDIVSTIIGPPTAAEGRAGAVPLRAAPRPRPLPLPRPAPPTAEVLGSEDDDEEEAAAAAAAAAARFPRVFE